MNTALWPGNRGFLVRWIIATLVGWVVGMVGAIILSYLVVNLVYPKETNLIVGLCAGAAVALAQKVAVRRWITLSKSWVWGAVIGIGIPFIAIVLLDELQPGASTTWELPLIVAGSAICGLLQLPALRSFTSRAYWWIIASTGAWSLAWISSSVGGTVGFLLGGGLVLGAVSGGILLWLRTPQAAAKTT